MASLATNIFHKPSSDGNLKTNDSLVGTSSILQASSPMDTEDTMICSPIAPTKVSHLDAKLPADAATTKGEQNFQPPYQSSMPPTPAELYKKMPPKRPIKEKDQVPSKADLYNEVPQRKEQNYKCIGMRSNISFFTRMYSWFGPQFSLAWLQHLDSLLGHSSTLRM